MSRLICRQVTSSLSHTLSLSLSPSLISISLPSRTLAKPVAQALATLYHVTWPPAVVLGRSTETVHTSRRAHTCANPLTTLHGRINKPSSHMRSCCADTPPCKRTRKNAYDGVRMRTRVRELARAHVCAPERARVGADAFKHTRPNTSARERTQARASARKRTRARTSEREPTRASASGRGRV